MAGLLLTDYPPSWEKIPPVEDPGLCGSGGTGVAQLVAHSTLDRCVVGSSPTRGTEHFGFPPPPSAPRLGNQRPWYVQPRLDTTGHIKDPVPLIEKRRGLSPGGRFPPSFIHQVIITGLNKLYNCMFSP